MIRLGKATRVEMRMGSQLRGHNVPWRCKAGDCDGGGGPRRIDLERQWKRVMSLGEPQCWAR